MNIIFDLISISGIFGGKEEELDILPPPPPFPKIGSKAEEAKYTEKIPAGRKNEEERAKRLGEKRTREEERITRKNEKKRMIVLERLRVQQEKKMQRGLEGKKRKEEQRMHKEAKKREWQETAKKGAEKIEISPIKPERRKLSIKEHFAGIFPSISFGKKEKRMEISEELQELPLPKKKLKAQKPMALEADTPEFMPRKAKEKKVAGKEPDFLLKESEMASMPQIAEDDGEIQKAIESLRQPKRKPLLGGIFAKKEKMPKAQPQIMDELKASEIKVEMPHVMPRTYDKIDHVEIAEAKIHKARMALMEFNFEEAKRIYVEIMKAYNNMEPKEKQEVYEDIRDLYYERKSAERFANK